MVCLKHGGVVSKSGLFLLDSLNHMTKKTYRYLVKKIKFAFVFCLSVFLQQIIPLLLLEGPVM